MATYTIYAYLPGTANLAATDPSENQGYINAAGRFIVMEPRFIVAAVAKYGYKALPEPREMEQPEIKALQAESLKS